MERAAGRRGGRAGRRRGATGRGPAGPADESFQGLTAGAASVEKVPTSVHLLSNDFRGNEPGKYFEKKVFAHWLKK